MENDKIKYNTTIYKTINKYKYPSPDLIIKHLTQYRPGDKFIIKGKLCYRTGRMAGIYRLDSSGAWSRQSMLSSSSQLHTQTDHAACDLGHTRPHAQFLITAAQRQVVAKLSHLALPTVDHPRSDSPRSSTERGRSVMSCRRRSTAAVLGPQSRVRGAPLRLSARDQTAPTTDPYVYNRQIVQPNTVLM